MRCDPGMGHEVLRRRNLCDDKGREKSSYLVSKGHQLNIPQIYSTSQYWSPSHIAHAPAHRRAPCKLHAVMPKCQAEPKKKKKEGNYRGRVGWWWWCQHESEANVKRILNLTVSKAQTWFKQPLAENSPPLVLLIFTASDGIGWLLFSGGRVAGGGNSCVTRRSHCSRSHVLQPQPLAPVEQLTPCIFCSSPTNTSTTTAGLAAPLQQLGRHGNDEPKGLSTTSLRGARAFPPWTADERTHKGGRDASGVEGIRSSGDGFCQRVAFFWFC